MTARTMQQNMQLSFQRYHTLINQSLQWMVLVYQVAAAVLFLGGLYYASLWFKQPFLGAFYEHTLVFNGTGPAEGTPEWALFKQVEVGDQLIAIEGNPVSSAQQIGAILKDRFPGEQVNITVLRKDGSESSLAVTLHSFPASSRTVYFAIPTILSIIFLGASLWIFGLRRTEPAGRAFSLFTSSLAIVTGTYFNLVTTHEFTTIWTAAAAICAGALINLAVTFPLALRAVINRPYLRWTGTLISLVLFVFTYFSLFNFDQPTAYISRWRYIFGFIALSAIIYIGMNLYHAIYAQSPVVKTQSRTILGGTILAFIWLIGWLGLRFLHPTNFSPYLFLPLAIFPLIIGYTILRFRFLRTDEIARRGLMYVLLSVLVVGGYYLMVLGLGLFLGTTIPVNNAFVVGGFLLLLVILLEPIRIRLQRLVDGIFFRGERAYEDKIREFTHELTTALDLQTIGAALRQQIASTLAPSRIHVYTYDTLNDFFSALPGDDRRPTSDIRFTATSPFARYFQDERLPLYLDSTAELPPSLHADQSRLALLGARLFVALPGKQRVNGWLALGSRMSGQPYAPRDLQFLENLCDQASIAIERLQTVAHLERQIQEMNALTRVSQGVNVTPTFDDVLELIYAQTAQIIPSSHFHITLYNEASDYYYYGFCVENNERIHERENLPFSSNTDLGPEVIRKSRPGHNSGLRP